MACSCKFDLNSVYKAIWGLIDGIWLEDCRPDNTEKPSTPSQQDHGIFGNGWAGERELEDKMVDNKEELAYVIVWSVHKLGPGLHWCTKLSERGHFSSNLVHKAFERRPLLKTLVYQIPWMHPSQKLLCARFPRDWLISQNFTFVHQIPRKWPFHGNMTYYFHLQGDLGPYRWNLVHKTFWKGSLLRESDAHNFFEKGLFPKNWPFFNISKSIGQKIACSLL
jgi:hypothetical protein